MNMSILDIDYEIIDTCYVSTNPFSSKSILKSDERAPEQGKIDLHNTHGTEEEIKFNKKMK